MRVRVVCDGNQSIDDAADDRSSTVRQNQQNDYDKYVNILIEIKI